MAVRVLIVAEPGGEPSSLEQQLVGASFDTQIAPTPAAALELARQDLPDLILLDDRIAEPVGSDFHRLLEVDPATAHTPLVRASTVDDAALPARLRRLARLKALSEEIRAREASGGLLGSTTAAPAADHQEAIVALLDDGSRHIPELLTMLSSFGTVITFSVDGATERLRQTPCDIILLGLVDGHIDGLRTVSQLREQPETRQLPILAFVDGETRSALSRGFDLGIDDGVRLPEERSSIPTRIQALLHDKRQGERLRERLRSSVRLSATDAATGLYNRHYMMQHLANLIARARAGNRPLSLLLIDFDGFAQVNDALGRAAGDAVLGELARRVAASVRASDLAARCDGQRLAVILPDSPGEVAGVVAERLRKLIGDTPAKGLAVTASIGIASLRSADAGAEMLLGRAAEALFVAKHIGRNRVVGGAQEAAA